MATSAVSPIRKGFHTLNPYVVVPGAANVIEFLKTAFGAEDVLRIPDPREGRAGKLMHSEVRIGDSMLELSDASEQFPARPMALHMYAPDADAVYARAVAAGATSLYAPVDQDYGDRESGIKDPGGNIWYIATHKASGPDRYVPEGLRTVNIYVHAQGAPALIEFLTRAVAATVELRIEDPDGRIAHAKLRVGDSILEMGEAHDQWQPMPGMIHSYVDDADAWYRRAMEAGGTSFAEPTDQPYGDRTAAIQDPAGNTWYFATHVRDVQF